jgi:hypothetical protein
MNSPIRIILVLLDGGKGTRHNVVVYDETRLQIIDDGHQSRAERRKCVARSGYGLKVAFDVCQGLENFAILATGTIGVHG